MSKKSRIQYEIGIASHVGKKRAGKPNQDSCIVLKSKSNRDIPTVLIVADGMGGYAGGAIASRILINRFSSLYNDLRDDEFSMENFARQGIGESQREMQKKASDEVELANMGSTIVAVSLENGKVGIVNVGDSRAYLFQLGEIIQLSFDHSFVGEALRAGLITQIEAINHPKKNQLTQSISARRYEVKPYYAEHTLNKDSVVLLCSDGLWGVISESVMQAIVLEMKPQEAADKLIKLANSRGGPDNISVIVAKRKDSTTVIPFDDVID